MGRSTIAALATLAAVLLPVSGPAALADAVQPASSAPASPGPLAPVALPSAAAPATATPSPSAPPSPSPSAARSAAPAPGAVRSPAWQAVQGGARLSWEAPADAAAGTTYTVVVHGAGPHDVTRTTAAPRLELVPAAAGTRLSATVTAEAADGTPGPATAAPSWIVPAAPPGAPASAALTASRNGTGLRVAWTPPATLGGATLTGFVVELRTVAAPGVVVARRTAPASGRAVPFAAVRAGIRYFATVAAVSAAGTGAVRETPTVVLHVSRPATCATCAAVSGTRQTAPATAATATPAAVPAAPRASDVAAVSAVPTSSGMPWRLAAGIAGIVIAACLAVAAVLLRRRSAVG